MTPFTELDVAFGSGTGSMSDVNAVAVHPREARRRRRQRKVPQWKAARLQDQIRRKEADLGVQLNGGVPAGRNATFSQRDFDQARQRALRDNIRMLVRLLSETLKNHAGEDLLDFVERIRLLSKARRTDDPLAMLELNAIIENLIQDLPRTQTILKAFALYFQLVNIAEEQQRVRVLRHRARVSREQGVPDRENIAFAIHWLFQEGVSTEDMRRLLDALTIKPVFTAHPTEANRRTVLFKHKVISDVLTELDLIALTPEEEAGRLRLISENILSLWQTDENREQQPTVIDEVQHGLYYLSNTVFELIPHVYRELEKQVRKYFPRIDTPVPIFLRYGSWIGGDRDGNPNVTYRETRRTLEEQQRRLIDLYIAEVNILYAHLSMSVNHSAFTDGFLEHLRAAIRRLPRRELALVEKVRREPYRQMFAIIRRRLEATRRHADQLWTGLQDDPMVYVNPGELMDDLEAVSDSLRRSKGELLASGRVARLITSVQVCGLHFVTLDIRQHSERHSLALDEIFTSYAEAEPRSWMKLPEEARVRKLEEELATRRPLTADLRFSDDTNETVRVFRTIRQAKDRMGDRVIDSYIISMTESASQVLEVLLLAKDASLFGDIDIVPLFESIEDLVNAPSILRALFRSLAYRAHLHARGDHQPIMIGYSDSNKDGGYLSANWSLYKAQKEVVAVCDEFGIRTTLFHGRGGSVSRGGGNVVRAIATQPPDTIRGSIKLTEQGEVISTHYAKSTIARRHMEQLIGTVLLNSGRPRVSLREGEWAEVMEELHRLANRQYVALVSRPELIKYFMEATPVEAIAKLNIGSRPAKRRDTEGVQDLRAIPWVFAWTQCRVNLTNWYGVGSAISRFTNEGRDRGRVELLRRMYVEWEFFRILIQNVQMAIWKSDLFIAHQYAALTDPDTEVLFNEIISEFSKTRDGVLQVTGRDDIADERNWLYTSIQRRNPYLDPLSFIQIALLQALRTEQYSPEELEMLENALSLSVKGLAAGLAGTG